MSNQEKLEQDMMKDRLNATKMSKFHLRYCSNLKVNFFINCTDEADIEESDSRDKRIRNQVD